MFNRLIFPAVLLVSTAAAGFAQKIGDPYLNPDPPSLCDSISGNLVANCGFESGDFSHWTLSGNPGFVLITTDSNSGTYAASFGAIGSATILTQSISDTSGANYTLDYYLQNDSGPASGFNQFYAQWDGTTIAGSELTNDSSHGYEEFSFTVTGTGSDSLSFAFQQNPSFFQFDDVSLVANVAATPEPYSIALLFTVVALCALVLRKRASKAPVS